MSFVPRGLIASSLVWLLAACGGGESQGEPGESAGQGAEGGSSQAGQGGKASAAGAATAGRGGQSPGGATGQGGVGQTGAGQGGMSGGSGQAGAAGGTAGKGGFDAIKLHGELEVSRQACKFGPGDKTTETIGASVPHGDALPFEHIVVLMLENRSFDHYFSKLPQAGVTDVDVADETHFNYDPSTTPPLKVPFHHEDRYCVKDVNHEWGGVHLQYDQGAMDGFVSTSNPGGSRAMGYYDQNDLPYYYWMAKNFGLSDRNFCSLLGPTWPNRFYFYGGTSWGNTKTGDLGDLVPGSITKSGTKILDQLEDAGRSWKIYRDGLVSFAIVFKQNAQYYGSPMSKFEEDVDADTLPSLAILDPNFSGSGQNDEHPPANVQKGQQLTARVLNKLMSKPNIWKKTVFFLMYDEHGGYYDHVPPPEACEPDNEVPSDFKFDRLGIRTPLFVASPFVKKGYVSHLVTDHTSVTRFIQNRFDLPAMTHRDANAWPLLDFFDFENPPLSTPPKGAPSAIIDAEAEQWCKNNPPSEE